MSILEVCDLKKSFGKTEVLKGISFSVEQGEVISILGSSGSGKTTLLRCLNFLETPNAGKILVNGKEIFSADAKKSSDKEIRENRLNFGLVFQQFNLFPQYTVFDNLTLAAKLRAKETAKLDKSLNKKELYAQIEKHALDTLESVGLLDKKGFYPCQLSGGQQQRVAIARALMLSPKILCFDEPTSALDPELTGEVLRVIRGLKGADSTMVVVTHEMEFAKSVADVVIFMADGVIAEMGTPEELFGNPQTPQLQHFLSRAEEIV